MKLDFIQIGANIGNLDDFIGLKIQSQEIKNGIFIEPNPKCVEILKTKFNNSSYFIEQIAIKHYCGTTILYVDHFDTPGHYSQIASTKDNFTKNHPWSRDSELTEIEVKCETIENLWQNVQTLKAS